LRFARMYTGDDPEAPNWDAGRRQMRSPITSSRGPRLENSWDDWATHRAVLARYPAQASNQLISEEWVSAARSRWDLYVATYGEKAPKGVPALAGLDVAELGDDSSAFCMRYGGYVAPYLVWSGVDVTVSGKRAAKYYLAHNIRHVFIDANGVGAGTAPTLREELRRLKVKNYGSVAVPVKTAESPTVKPDDGEFKILRDQLWWAVREWLKNDPGAMLPPDDELLEELLIPTYEQVGRYIRIMEKKDMRKLLGRSPDRADALCLTFAPRPAQSLIAFV